MVAGRRPSRAAAALAAMLLSAPVVAQVGDWRQVATRADRGRLREWRSAWMAALSGATTRDPLFDPDRALAGSLPPSGAYRCRRIRLGGAGAGTRDWGRCRIASVGDEWRLTSDEAGQRAEGVIYPDTDVRSVFLGTWRMADERRAIAYGRDEHRNLPGVIERVGAGRWRLVLPYPGFGAVLELVEMGADGAG
jgi:hypothetical protein